jgi:hypothetical protein
MSAERSVLGRLLARLTGTLQLERLAAVEEKVAKFGRAQRDELAAQRALLEQLRDLVSTRAATDAVKSMDRRIEALQTALARQDRTMSDAFERAGRFDEQAVDDRRFARRIEQLRRHDRPIIVGPWTGEVGFELLYWIPFLRWTIAKYGLDPGRLIVVSRGGTGSWYGAIAGRYIDIFSLVTPAEYRAATEDAKKQRRVGAFDADIVAKVRASHGLQQAELLHPGMMYRLLNPFWKEVATVARVDAYTDHARMTAPAADILADLPDEYVAVRFYFSECFPDTPSNRSFVAATLDTLSHHLPVVLLDAPFAVDDHRDYASAARDVNDGRHRSDVGAEAALSVQAAADMTGARVGLLGGKLVRSRGAAAEGRVISIASRMTPETNLAVQTAAIARARAFVGTYGGYSYLAPLHGVPSIAFYSERTFKPHHLHVAHRVFERLGGADVLALDVAQVPLVNLALTAPAAVGRA